ncbi:hypothetical protein [Flavobacterium frigidarium]|jgi:hypothetical protein|uniref:Immunoglobulin-like domain of spore germination n=1 Tax=Flavobacterium frigidarium TaxID=99286 RepID=A0ABV4KD03_9FLAO
MKNTNLKIKMILFTMLVTVLSCKEKSAQEYKNLKELKSPSIKQVETAILPTVNIKDNDKLTSPALIKVNSQGVWFANEGSLGYIQLLDDQGNEIATNFLTTNENWMKEGSVNFSANLIFDAKGSKVGSLVIHNDPGSGDGDEAGEKISFTIPVTF